MLENETPVPLSPQPQVWTEIPVAFPSVVRADEVPGSGSGSHVGSNQFHEALQTGKRRITPRKGFRTVFLIALCGGILAEAVLFLQRQLNEVSALLQEDFRIILTVDGKITRDQARVAEEKLRALAYVKDVDFVGREDRLKRLEASDPDIVGSVVLLGENPVPDSFEVKIDESALGDIPSWTDSAKNINGIASARYKPVQAYAILQVLFYERFLRFSLSAAALFLVLLGIMTVFYRVHWPQFVPEIAHNIRWVAAGAAGALLSAALCFALVYPIKYLSPLWAWPGWGWHAGVVFLGGFTGWILFQWKNTR